MHLSIHSNQIEPRPVFVAFLVMSYVCLCKLNLLLFQISSAITLRLYHKRLKLWLTMLLLYTSVKIIFKNSNMGIEIAEKSKETKVKQASMLNTQRSLFGLNGYDIARD